MNPKLITIGTQTLSVTDWCRYKGMNKSAYYHRVTILGWPPEKALTTPINAARVKKKLKPQLSRYTE